MKILFFGLILGLIPLLLLITLVDLHQRSYIAIAQNVSSSSVNLASQNQTKQIVSNDTITIKLLADSLGNRLNQTAAILEVTSFLPQVKNVSYAKFINPIYHGIPQNLDSAKRAIAQQILAKYHDFDIVFFLMPNGDMYIMEPYSQQAHLTKNNYAFRDYYKGAIETNNTYLGGVIISTATGKKQAVISVPIYSETKKLVGIWGGDLSLKAIENSLQALNISSSNSNASNLQERVVFVDQNGKKVADSDKSLSSNQNESFVTLQSFKNGEGGKTGSLVEDYQGKRMLITFQPVKLNTTNWVILLMRPFQ